MKHTKNPKNIFEMSWSIIFLISSPEFLVEQTEPLYQADFGSKGPECKNQWTPSLPNRWGK